MDEETRKFLKMIGSVKTVDILAYIREHGAAHHRDLNAFVSTHTLHTRLIQLAKYGLIEHHYERHDTKKEWYTLTEKGNHVLTYVDNMVKLLD